MGWTWTQVRCSTWFLGTGPAFCSSRSCIQIRHSTNRRCKYLTREVRESSLYQSWELYRRFSPRCRFRFCWGENEPAILLLRNLEGIRTLSACACMGILMSTMSADMQLLILDLQTKIQVVLDSKMIIWASWVVLCLLRNYWTSDQALPT